MRPLMVLLCGYYFNRDNGKEALDCSDQWDGDRAESG